ncbi:MAG: GntR family transcriptional regulator [Alcaligenaceae bacterium]|jgi:DNA-binding GntR family transcriptional regulator|nr:GntR family transcriptional regulator [Alcaligenaceae bacterium]
MLYLDQHDDLQGESTAPRASSLLERRGQKIGRVSEVDRVYAEIFDAVMDRRLLPGAKLTESALCDIFSCSRATVRAALAQLGHDKIVVLLPNRGAYVWQPDPAETREVFEARRTLECVLIDKLLQMPDLSARLEPLREMVRQEKEAFETGDRISWLRLSNAFHVKMARLVGNHVLTEFMHALCCRTTLIIAFHDTPSSSTCSYMEHDQILDLLLAGNREGAIAAMCHHLEDCEHRVEETQTRKPDPWSVFTVKR